MILTQFTQTAIAVLHDISSGSIQQTSNVSLSMEEWKDLFHKLETGGLIRRLSDKEEGVLTSYELLQPFHELTVLDLLIAINEPLNCARPVTEGSYSLHRIAAQKLGVLSQVIRMFLSDIKICDW